MVNLIMDPNGEKALESSSNQDSTFQTKIELNANVGQLQEKNMTLEQKVMELQEKLTKVSKSICKS